LGRELACRVLESGVRVVLEDFSPSTLEEAVADILRRTTDKPSDHLGQKRSSTDLPPSNLLVCNSVEAAIRDADLIIETAADEMETKLELFTIFDKFAKPDAIFATTSHVHSIAEIADITACPERCVALWPDPPMEPTRLLLVAGPRTSAGTINACRTATERLFV
jgi:3-hydroxyacyl-CoA dehydrogenase